MDASMGRDAAVRVKERLVAIELPPVARRTVRPGPDGEFVYGEFELLDGATSCIVRRRKAFATFQPFEELAPADQICKTTGAGDVVRLEGVPASSDLVISVTKDGFLPASLTFRVETLDVAVPPYFGSVRTPLFEPGQTDPWLEPSTGEGETGTAMLSATMVVYSANEGANEGIGYDGIVPTWATTEGAHLTLTLEGATNATPIELDTLAERPLFLELPAGSYRVHATHPRARCEPVAGGGYTPWGLLADGPNEHELPVLEGHAADLHLACWCFPKADQVLLDFPSCTVEDAAVTP
jgi:hypothetical protein